MFGWSFRGKERGGRIRVLPFDKVVNKRKLKSDTKKIWECVSLSRSQFQDHYVGLIRNVAVYMQNEVAFSAAMSKGVEALQGTMLVRLPYDRTREEGARVEQLWKFTMFACHLIREASVINRNWYDRKGRQLLFVDFSERGMKYVDAGACNGVTILSNLNQIIPANAAEWLMQDNGLCVVQLNKAANGEVCFVDLKRGEVEVSTERESVGNASVDVLDNNKEKIGLAVSDGADADGKGKGKGKPVGVKTAVSGGSNVVGLGVGVEKDDTFEADDEGFAVNESLLKAVAQNVDPDESENVPRRAARTDEVAKMLGVSLGGAAEVGKSNDGANVVNISRAVVHDEKIPTKKNGHRNSVGLSDVVKASAVKGFVEWLDVNVEEWEITPCERKAFNYQKTVQQYLNSGHCDIEMRAFGRVLVSSGFDRVNVGNQQLMAVPEGD